MTLGPVQLIVVVVESGRCEQAVLVELGRLGDDRSVELIDFLFVAKDEDGDLRAVDRGSPEVGAPARSGRMVARLIGGAAEEVPAVSTGKTASAFTNGNSGGQEDVWYLADAIPRGAIAVVALIEHRWAIPLRAAAEEAVGHTLVDHWVHAEDLAAIRADPG